MKKIIVSLVSLFFFHGNILAQGVIQWQNTIGGNDDDVLHSIQQTYDGGYILGGYSKSSISGDKTENSNGGEDYWIVKTDSLGNIQWQNTIGGNGYDRLYSIQQTTDGGYILGGSSNSNISGDKTEDNNNGSNDYWIVKTDSLGTIQWQNTIGGSGGDNLFSVQQTFDGGFILGGYSWSGISGDKTENSNGTIDYWILKTDSLGNIQWQNTIGGNFDDYFSSVQQTEDGGYILGGYSWSGISGDKTENTNGSTDFWIVKIDSTGNILWQNTIGGDNVENLYSIQQTADRGYILGGQSNSNVSGDKSEVSMGGSDYWIVKTDASGNIQWQNTIGGSGNDQLRSIQQTKDGGYILGGWSNSIVSGDKLEPLIGGLGDYWIVKTDSMGSILWQNTIGGYDLDVLNSVWQTVEGGYILGGESSSNLSGDKSENSNGQSDFWIIKIAPDIVSGVPVFGFLKDALAVYPNPTSNELTISSELLTIQEIEIHDVFGKLPATPFINSERDTKSERNRSQRVDVSSLSPGIYFMKVKTGTGISTLKFIKQ